MNLEQFIQERNARLGEISRVRQNRTRYVIRAGKHAVIPDETASIGARSFADDTGFVSVTIPDTVTAIGYEAFENCSNLTSVTIPDGVKAIEKGTFRGCTALTSIVIPDSVIEIGTEAFKDCTSLSSVTLGSHVNYIGKAAFSGCTSLTSVTIPESMLLIGEKAFENCTGLISAVVQGQIDNIHDSTFSGCRNLTSVTMPEGVSKIGDRAFFGCVNLPAVTIPKSVTTIGKSAFEDCLHLASVSLPDGLDEISGRVFEGCPSLDVISVPTSVRGMGYDTFDETATIVCREGSYANRFCLENQYSFLFDYQFEAFHGILPAGFENLSAPFLADEEQPFVFISYSHKDRDAVLPIIKTLYESGWKIWYDEGLTIGDRYDETLEGHVRNCSAFLLFATNNSLNSRYCLRNEIPWAIRYGKPIVRCILEKGIEYPISEDAVAATVSQSEIEPALEKIGGLAKGEKRIAKGISVIVNPSDRHETNIEEDGSRFAYCLYADRNATTAQTILLEAENSGCALYDAAESGADEEKLKESASLIVFLDHAFLSDRSMTDLLIREYRAGKDLAVCQLEELHEEDLPSELASLRKMQWLNFVHGIKMDMNTKLARHLQKRGCRDTAALPGFDYRKQNRALL